MNKFKSKPTAGKSKLNMWAKVVELTEEENVSKMLSAKILDKMRKQKIDEKDDVSDKSKTKKKGGKGAASTKSEGAAISEIQISNNSNSKWVVKKARRREERRARLRMKIRWMSCTSWTARRSRSFG